MLLRFTDLLYKQTEDVTALLPGPIDQL